MKALKPSGAQDHVTTSQKATLASYHVKVLKQDNDSGAILSGDS
jgi:hypothetical protein